MLGPVMRRICCVVVERAVVRHEAVARERRLDDGMAAVADDDRRRRDRAGADVAAVVRQLGERDERVERTERARGLGERALVDAHVGDELREELRLELPQTLLGAEQRRSWSFSSCVTKRSAPASVCLRM